MKVTLKNRIPMPQYMNSSGIRILRRHAIPCANFRMNKKKIPFLVWFKSQFPKVIILLFYILCYLKEFASAETNSNRTGSRTTKPTLEDVLPRKNISSEALIKYFCFCISALAYFKIGIYSRFLKAKVSILQQDLSDSKKEKELRSQNDKIRTEKLQQLSSSEERLRNENKTLSEEVERVTKLFSDSAEIIKVRD